MELSKAPKTIRNNYKVMKWNRINNICRNKLTRSIGNIRMELQSRKNFKFVVFTPRLQITGFATAEERGQQLYISYLCSNKQGGGTRLLNAIEKYGRDNGFKLVFLESLAQAQGFYIKKGYKKRFEDLPNNFIYEKFINQQGQDNNNNNNNKLF